MRYYLCTRTHVNAYDWKFKKGIIYKCRKPYPLLVWDAWKRLSKIEVLVALGKGRQLGARYI